MAITPIAGGRTWSTTAVQLLSRIQTAQAPVGVIGLGREGLPVAVAAATAGFRVLGIDPDADRVETIEWGLNDLPEVDDAALAEAVGRGRLEATTGYARLAELDVVIIALPAPGDGPAAAGTLTLEGVARELTASLRPGQLVCLHTALVPGTTDDVVRPALEGHGLRVEKDFFLAIGGPVVGGAGPASLALAQAFHERIGAVAAPVSSTQAAELVTTFARMFRAVNVALANEMAMLCERMDLDVWEVLGAAFTKPAGISPFYPGPALAVPGVDSPFVALANRINQQVPALMQARARRALNARGLAPSCASILVVGLGDPRAHGIALLRLLRADGAEVSYHDPAVPALRVPGLALSGVPLDEETVAAHDLVIVASGGPGIDVGCLAANAPHVLDLCNTTRAAAFPRVTISRR